MTTAEKDRRRTRAAAKAARPRQRKKAPTRVRPESEEIVYTPPKPFQRKQFLLRMATVLAVVLALVFGLSIFFKVDKVMVSHGGENNTVGNVTVTGSDRYTPWEVMEASGIRHGENLLGLNKAQISGNIISKLPYVSTVRISIELPDTVHIEITELARQQLYVIQDDQGAWWLITKEGRIVRGCSSEYLSQYTQLTGVTITEAAEGAYATAFEDTTEETDTVVTGAQKLSLALTIAAALEENEISGPVSTVDVSRTTLLEFWYEDRYQVQMGDGTNLPYKVHAAAKAISQMEDYQSGVLDVSFTLWPDKVVYSPFS